MEEYKLWYLNSLLHRAPTPETNLDSCVKAVRGFEEHARQSYAEPINLSSDEFVEMMLVDGCFIIELFRKYTKEELRDPEDPIFNSSWMLSSLQRDFILLENQLPFFVLECLFNLTSSPDQQDDHDLSKLALDFFHYITPMCGENVIVQAKYNIRGKHLLDLLHNSFIPSSLRMKLTSISTSEFIHCVMVLRDAGIEFKQKQKAESFLDISYTNGVLEIPILKVDEDYTGTLFRNLIAFEQCSNNCTTHITSYAFIMSTLIKSSEDVGYLQRKRIIAHCFGNNGDVSLLFNKLSKEVVISGFYYGELCEQVNTYYRTRWHKWRATLKRDYFNNPWVILSCIAATLLLILTFTGTLFPVLSFFLHHS